MKNLTKLLVVFLLAACGSKDNVSTQGNVDFIGGGGQGEISPIDAGGPANPGTLIQIACQSDHGISLPNSLMPSGQRFVDIIPDIGEQTSTSPTVLGVNGNLISTLIVSGSKIYSSQYDFSKHANAQDPVVVGKAGSSSSEIYRDLGFSQPRLAATSPDGRSFLVSTGGTVSLRAVSDPLRTISTWRGTSAFAQPRWDGDAVFIDRTSGGKLRQAVISVDANGNQLEVKNAPKALADSLHQIGLRRFNAGSYIWLEHSADRAVLRVWTLANDNVKNYELPNAKALGPGFALIRSASGTEARAVLNSREGVFYYTLGANGKVGITSALYPEDTQRRINNRETPPNWEPGAIYSAADDTQLFVILPSTFGNRMLMSIDKGISYRLIGFESCVNPDFYRARN